MARAMEAAVHFVADGLQLEGRLATPAPASRGAVICHPHPQYGGTMDNNVVLAVAAALQAAGVATLRFNFRGVGLSEGKYDGGQGEARDTRAAVVWLGQQLGAAPVTLAGYSFGAIVALLAGHNAEAVERLVAIAPPVTMFDMKFLAQCRVAKLFVLGDRDQYCPRDAMEQCVATLAEPKRLQCLAGADHFFVGHEAAVADAVTGFVLE